MISRPVDGAGGPSADARSARRSSIGVTAPPPKLWVFSTETAAVRTKNGPMSGAKRCRTVMRSSGVPTQVRIVIPVMAAWMPSSARAMCAEASHRTS